MSIDLSLVAPGDAPIRVSDLPRIEAIATVADYRLTGVAESPVWHEDALWWCDIPAGKLYEHTPGSKTSVLRGTTSGPLSAIRPATGGELVLAGPSGIYHLTPGDEFPGDLLGGPAQLPGRFNDMEVAPDGSVYVGVLSDAPAGGLLFRAEFTAGGCTFTLAATGLHLPNGIGFADANTILIIDSTRGTIFAAEITPTGLNGARPWASFDTAGGLPDGLRRDDEGGWWVAMWGAGCLVRLDDDGHPLGRLDLPISYPTCPEFGAGFLWVTAEGGQASDPALVQVSTPLGGAERTPARVP